MPNFISEDQIEKAMVQKLVQLHGFGSLNCHTEDPEDLKDQSGRASKRDVILIDRVREAAGRLNPTIPQPAIESALERFLDRRQAMSLVAANQEVYGLLRDGIPVEFDDVQGKPQKERVFLVDFNTPESNRFLAVTQLWIRGEKGFRRPDLLLYVNGLPLVFFELKNSNIKLKTAFDDNLTNYKLEIPQLFLTNVFCVLSNAIETKVGSITAEWEHFFNWLRADDEKEKIDREAIKAKGTSLESVIAGLLPPGRLLDYVENFVLYYKDKDKIIAQNHQFIGVNRAYEKFLHREELGGKLGVFWHTQGSGKSFSMIFYARKIFRKQTGNFTFVVVTDREDLDGQIYRNFLHTNTVTKAEAAQPKNSEEMRKFLGQNKRLVFTLIQKFRWDKGKAYPLLSDRSDIIVMVDEAHRTQYKDLAENMRAGLKNAQYIAFTGTPLLGSERKTNQWFGGYVSEYNFMQSMDDGATVPLFYKKRVPQVLIQNDDLTEDLAEICEDENLDDAQKAKLENRFAQEIEVIKRDDRLDIIAADIVYHFPRRGYLGKGMVVSLDKFTAVKMYDKVQDHWKKAIKELRGQIKKAVTESEKRLFQKQLDYMRSVEMAVVVSEEGDEEKKFAKQKLNIKPHRDRMNRLDEHGHDVEYNFKDPENPLQLVFVCAMWLTGFDAPTLSTLYLDKPMKDHTLMQTIARANRVTSWKIDDKEKKNGEIVDYYNVFRNMRKALKDYAQGEDGQEAMPVQEKDELFKLLDDAIAQGMEFCSGISIDLSKVLESKDVFKNVSAFEKYADTMLTKDEWRKGFAVYENTITGLYEACKPEILGKPIVRTVAVFQYLRGVLDAIIEQTDIDAVALRVGELLDETFDGWTASVGPTATTPRLQEREYCPPAGILAASMAISELFLHFAEVSIGATRRSLGLSLWRPDLPMSDPAALGVPIEFLPRDFWTLGLGHLGNAYLWAVATLPYVDPQETLFFLNDFDTIEDENFETSLLLKKTDTGTKTRACAAWLEKRGFRTRLIERPFDANFRRRDDEPGLALCGFDSNPARRALATAQFLRVVESGLGGTADNFDTINLNTLPNPRPAVELWPDLPETEMLKRRAEQERAAQQNSAYARIGRDECGRFELAGKSIAVPFVGAAAGAFAVSEVLRLLHRGPAYKQVKLAMATLNDRSAAMSGNYGSADFVGLKYSAARPI